MGDVTGARIQHVAIVVVAVAVPLVFTRAALSTGGWPKLTVALVGGLAVALLAAVPVAIGGKLSIPRFTAPRGAFTVAVLVYLLALAVSVAIAPNSGSALWGLQDRPIGALLYLACAVLALATAAMADVRRLRQLVIAVAVTGGVASLYAIAQHAGIDPFDWPGALRGSASTLGNPNFAAGYFAVVLPLAGWLVADGGLDRRLRLLGAVLVVLLVAGIATTRTIQGPAAAGAGLAAFGAAWLLTRGGRPATVASGVMASLAVAGLGGAAFGVVGRGPLSALGARESWLQRLDFWEAAWAMARDAPLLGVGFRAYGSEQRAYRTEEAALRLPASAQASDPHSVPLGMFAEGGFLLGLAYLAVVAVVGWALVHGWRRSDASGRLLLAGLGGGWVAYQVQSLVSIDQAPLAVTHWLLAGAIIGLGARPEPRVVTLPWGRARLTRRQREGRQTAAVLVAALVLVALLLPSTRTLRADLAAREALDAAERGDGPGAIEQMDRALDLAGWNGEYWDLRGRIFQRGGLHEPALESFGQAVDRESGRYASVLNAARAAQSAGDLDSAGRWYAHLLAIEPHAPEAKIEAARFELEHGEREAGIALLEQALETDPENETAAEILAAER
jgi:O-antigen ligase